MLVSAYQPSRAASKSGSVESIFALTAQCDGMLVASFSNGKLTMVMSMQRARLCDPLTYRPLHAQNVLSYLHALGFLDPILGGTPSQWSARECGDGNLNLIFVVRGPSGSVVVKQALPYVRMVGESWPLSVRRNFFEHAALVEHARWASEFVPGVLHSDEAMALIVMEFLTPHSVLRSELIQGHMHAHVGEHLGRFLARTLFNTSELRLGGQAKKDRQALFLANTAMCQISEDLIFDEPYFQAPMNRHTSPQLNSAASALRGDADLKVVVQALKWQFTNQSECLIHGDLHTGSVMVTETDTRIIDPEFAFYGPMGFDIGTLLANFLMAYLSQRGHESREGERHAFQEYLLHQLTSLWSAFDSEFSAFWRERGSLAAGNLYNPRLDDDSGNFSERALASRIRQIWQDTVGFAGSEIIRRIFGLAHVADFEKIDDPDRRAACEQRGLSLARELLMHRSHCLTVSDLATLARSCE